MGPVTEERMNRIRERDRARQLEAYHNNPEYRAYHINYVLMRRQDPAYREHRNALVRANYARKKALKELEENKENIPMNVN